MPDLATPNRKRVKQLFVYLRWACRTSLSSIATRYNHSACRPLPLYLFVLLSAYPLSLTAQAVTTSDKSDSLVGQTPVEPSSRLIKVTPSQFITINARRSKPQATPGDSFEIAADIENISTKPLYFNPLYVTMTPPPELDPQAPRDWYGTFPGAGTNYCTGVTAITCDEESQRDQAEKKLEQLNSDLYSCYHSFRKWNMFYHSYECIDEQTTKDRMENTQQFDKVVELRPGSTTTVFWNGHTRTDVNSVWSNMVAELILPPGPYSVTLVADFWDSEKGAKLKSLDRYSYSTVLPIPIVASQATIIIGSIIGGLFAYVLLPRTRFFVTSIQAGMSKMLRIRQVALSICASVMLSIIITILLSRLSDSQFIVKVTVNDFWGAIAIGFIVSASGKSILSKVTGLVQSDGRTATPTTP